MKIRQYLVAFSLLTAATSSFACDKEEFRQFDFWIGEWEVTTPDGNLAGHSKITKHLGECTLHEHYKTPKGFEGTSFNIYDRVNKQWHQSWVDNTGQLLKLDGGLVKINDKQSAMVMQGEGMTPTGQRVIHRITWTPSEDGTVRQHWESSGNLGHSWTTLFDGKYSKKKD